VIEQPEKVVAVQVGTNVAVGGAIVLVGEGVMGVKEGWESG
jgi:hypothetical protein